MGILRLGQFLKKTYPHLFKKVELEKYRGGVYAIDASSTIYSFLAKTVSISLLMQLTLSRGSTCRQIPRGT